MKTALLLIPFLLIGCKKEGIDYNEFQELHAKSHCGSMKPGFGLTKEKDTVEGWVASMIPGLHSIRVKGPGEVWFGHPAKLTEVKFNSGQMHRISGTGFTKDTVIEWKTPAGDWETLPGVFLYPRKISQAQRMVDKAIKEGWVIPGISETAEELKNLDRITPPEEYPAAIHKRKSEEAWAKLHKERQDD